MHSRRSATSLRTVTLLAALLGAVPAAAADAPAAPAQPPPQEVKWTPGPARVDVGESLAEVKLPETVAFADGNDTRKLLEAMGNITHGSEQGIIAPKADGEDWFIVFDWHPVGYVKDEEKDQIDADALFKSISENTERSNEERKKRGMPALHVVRWADPPRYDATTHNLTWALVGRNDGGKESVNYNVRVLGREGVMSVTLVDEPQNLAKTKPQVDAVLAAFSYKLGKRYAEWVPGDKVAEYGLTALVAAGAGAAAVKLGLFAMLGKFLAKSAKLVVVGLAALGGMFAKFWNALRGKASARPARPPGEGA
jgi:uncharacterized membrane-anchored protein